MSSSEGKGVDGEDPVEPSSSNTVQPNIQPQPQPPVQPQIGVHPMTYANMPMHMYAVPPGLAPPEPLRSKRRQVKNACTNCQKACKKCDDARPCLRCVKYGISDECVDSQRKERKKGVKRGPYKKRDDRANKDVEQPNVHQQPMSAAPSAQPIMAGAPAAPPYAVGYPPYYGQYSPAAMPKPGDGTMYPYYVAHMPTPAQQPIMQGMQEGQQPQAFYPTYVTPFMPPVAYPPYMAPHPDGQMPVAHPYPAVYGPPMYQKPQHPLNGHGDVANGNGQGLEGQNGAAGDK